MIKVRLWRGCRASIYHKMAPLSHIYVTPSSGLVFVLFLPYLAIMCAFSPFFFRVLPKQCRLVLAVRLQQRQLPSPGLDERLATAAPSEHAAFGPQPARVRFSSDDESMHFFGDGCVGGWGVITSISLISTLLFCAMSTNKTLFCL